MQAFILLLSMFFLLTSCSPEPEKKEGVPPESLSSQSHSSEKGCLGCHKKKLDPAHDFECITCHNGNNDSNDVAVSHNGMVAEPGHPLNMMSTCGKCHEEQVTESSHSLHFTMKNEVNLVRMAFGATESITTLLDIPVSKSPDNILELADDLLRRRCLRCHVYYTGDRYPGIVRGSGCASCHLSFYEGKLVSHSFQKIPEDKQCLQCHYGNRVGADYYGRFEHDMNDEYRTPYTTTNDYFRPFGIEYHQLQPDIHQQKGLACVDCHVGSHLMGTNPGKVRCESCHDANSLQQNMPLNVSQNEDNTYTLLSQNTKKQHVLPLMHHPAHLQYQDLVDCQVCHARWSFNDQQTHLLRSDLDEYDDFSRLTVQGSFEVEKILLNNLDYDADEIEPVMSDKISGELFPGLWHKGYVMRRWEEMPIGRDKSGKLRVMRPLLDMYLSWVDEDGEVRFDSVPASTENNGMLPYTPHTTGKAGLFYKDRIKLLFSLEKDALK
jgi:hypothetical protein